MRHLWEFFKIVGNSLPWIGFISFIFVLGIASGVIISLVNPDITRSFFQGYGESLQKVGSSSGLSTALSIFERNVIIILLSLLLGFLGLIPILVAYVNGMIFGMIFGFRDIYASFSAPKLLILILPHGVVEIVTTLVALGISTKTGLHWLFVRKDRKKTFLKDFREMFRASFFVVGFLALAALVEGVVTPALSCLIFRICF